MFNDGYPEHSKAIRVIKGIHSLHMYATEYWTEYLLSEASRHGGIGSDICVFRLARQLSDKLERIAPSSVQRSNPDQFNSDERLSLLKQHQALQEHVEWSLKSGTIEQLERELQSEQSEFRSLYPLLRFGPN